MSEVIRGVIDKSTAQAICDAVKEKEGSTEGVPFNTVADRIRALSVGGGENKLAQLVGGTLTEVTAEDLEGVTSIKQYAFYRQTQLKKITFSDSVTTIGTYAFSGCDNLEEIVLGNGITNIENEAFFVNKSNRKVYVPSLEAWCAIRFYDQDSSPLYSSYAPSYNPLLYIKNELGNYELLPENLIIPNTVKEIKSYTFYYRTRLNSVIIPDSVTQLLGSNAFGGCSNLTSVVIGNGVKTINSYCFDNCVKLTNLIIGTGVKDINGYAIRCGSADNKVTITFLGTTPPSIQTSTFYTANLEKIIVPKGCGEAYKTATNWANFADYIEEAAE